MRRMAGKGHVSESGFGLAHRLRSMSLTIFFRVKKELNGAALAFMQRDIDRKGQEREPMRQETSMA